MREDGKPREDGKLREDGKPRKCWGDVSRERSNGVTCLTWLQFPTSRLKKKTLAFFTSATWSTST